MELDIALGNLDIALDIAYFNTLSAIAPYLNVSA